jgi:Peptidase family C25
MQEPARNRIRWGASLAAAAALCVALVLAPGARAAAPAAAMKPGVQHAPAVPAPVRPQPVSPEPATPAPASSVTAGTPSPDSAAAEVNTEADIRWLPSGGSTIHFIVDVPSADLIVTNSNGEPGSAARIQLPGYEPARVNGVPLPERIVVIAVPPVGDVRLRALGAMPTTHENVTIDGISNAGSGGANAAIANAEPARVLGVGWLRNQRVARVAIRPASYDFKAHRMSIYGHVDVTLEVAAQLDFGTAAETRDPFETVYHDLLLNYEQGRHWRRPAASRRATVPRAGLDRLRKFAVETAPETTVFAGRLWVKLTVTQPGFYKVSYAQLRNTALFTQNGDARDTSNALDSLRLFTWPGTPVLPEKDFCDSCGYSEVALQFVDAFNDGNFGNNKDYFYFFALGPSDWLDVYDPTRTDSTYLDHPYETRNFYYLTLADTLHPVGGTPLRIGTASAAVTVNPATTPTTYPARARIEKDLEYDPDASPLRGLQDMFWEKWMWANVSIGASFADTFSVRGCDFSQPLRLRMRAWGLNNCATCSGPVIPPAHLLDLSFNGHPVITHLGWGDDVGVTFDTVLTSPVTQLGLGTNTLLIGIPSPSQCVGRQDQSALAWLELYYQHTLTPLNDEIAFDTPATADNFRYAIDGFVNAVPPRVFDVTDPANPFELTGFDYVNTGSAYRLTFERSQGDRRRYRIVPDANIPNFANGDIADAPQTSLQNLRSSTLGADFIVIYFDAFAAAADTLAAWRSSHLPLATPGPYRTLTVPISAIYDQFSGGRTDPAAIRNFLRAALEHWQAPRLSYVTLLGDASFDFKNFTGHGQPGFPSCLLPAYENGFDPSIFTDICSPIGIQFASDDWIFNVDSALAIVPDVLGGRIPVDDAATAMDYVRNKILFYERSAPIGEYRNRVMLIADDAQQADHDDPLHWEHVRQTRDLDTLATPLHIDRRYVYLHKYPEGPGFTKPGAKADIKKNIADGVAIWNFVGHGSPFKISDEGVFLDVDTGTLTNGTMMPLFVSASCDVGKFNDPAVQSLGERLITQSGGGAIGVISATGLAISTQNATLNQTIFQEIFRRDPLIANDQYHRSVAEALLAAKFRATETTQKYELMGDAALRLNIPHQWVGLTLWDSAGTTPVTNLTTGQVVTFKGTVLDHPGGTPLAYNGIVSMEIDDAAPLELTPDCPFFPGCLRYTYVYAPGVMFRGDAGVTNGAFQGRFVVPMEAATGVRGRLRAYVTGRQVGASFDDDGAGAVRASLSSGTAPLSDQTGPRITLSFVGGATTVRPTATLRVDLFDANGILTTNHNPQNGIVLTLDENTTQRADITPSFRYAANSYQSGTASFTLPNVANGPHTIEVSAADNLASGLSAGSHRSKASISFTVEEAPQLHIDRAYLFPDPTSSGGHGSGGTFVIDAPGDSVNVLLRLYTVAGRLFRTLRAYGGLGQTQIPWDGLDEEGSKLANGVYLFKVHVYGRDDDGSSSPTEKAITEGRFVIVNR